MWKTFKNYDKNMGLLRRMAEDEDIPDAQRDSVELKMKQTK
jgi:hypothetical protein